VFGILDHFGVEPAAAAGHSYGELTALCAAGRIDRPALHRLSQRRGRLMAEPGGGDRGAMLAVMAPLERIGAVLRDDALDVVIANKNAPEQAVLSGPAAEVARAARQFDGRGIATRPLPVGAAFHSRFVATARVPFAAALQHVALGPGRIPVYANTTGAVYPDDSDAARALLADQLASPVEFVAQIEAMHDAGVRTFLEAGPDRKLTALVDSILDGRTHAAIAVDASRGQRSNLADLARALAQLAALGHPLRLRRWDEGAEEQAGAALPGKPGLTVKVCGANSTPVRENPTPTPTHPKPEPSATMRPTPSARFSQPNVPPAGGNGNGHGNGNGASAIASGGARKAAPPEPAPPPLIPALGSSDPAVLAQALAAVQDNLVALQKLGEQTAQLHRQFLDGQDRTQRTFQTLLEQQQKLVLTSLGLAPAAPDPLARSWEGEPPGEPISRPARQEPRPPGLTQGHSAPAPASVPEPQAPPQPADRRVNETLLAIVAEKTGYPAEMLEPAMRLDADLGIDSIKRVEILSALQEQLPDAPVIKPEHLGTLQTLADIVAFLAASGAGTAEPASPVATPAAHVQETLLAIVTEKTGYPAEMLEPAMRLDADLGIDSIKRVEILSALQEQLPDAPVIKPEHLGTLQTLGDIVAFLAASGAGTAEPASPVATPAAHVQATLLAIVAEKTGYPAEMLEPVMRLDADLGIDSIKRVEILSALQEQLPDAPVIKPEHLGTLQTLGDIVEFLAAPVPAGVAGAESSTPRGPGCGAGASKTPPQPPIVEPEHPPLERLVPTSVALDQSVTRPAVRLRAGGEVWIAADDDGFAPALAEQLRARGQRVRLIGRAEISAIAPPGSLDGLVLLAPVAPADDAALKDAFGLLRAAAPALRQAGQHGGAVLATVTHLDGAFGLRGAIVHSHTDPVSGGLAGLAKTAAHEWPEVACKAIDVAPAFARDDAAAAVAATVAELLCRGPVEVGLARDGRSTIALVPTPLAPAGRADCLSEGDVVVISGGARGITAEVAVALAEAARPAIVLLGRSPAPEPEPDWLAALAGADEAAIKRALAARANGQATPQSVGEQFRRVVAAREIRHTLERIEAAGAKAVYHAVDVRDAAAVHACLGAVRATLGPIRGLIHGAGVLADRRIEDQTDSQFAAVYDTKVGGLRHLLAALGPDDDELRSLVLFSSSTARFGRTGQVAYAAANEVLNKWAQREAAQRPACRVVALDWGPWEGGMVTPALRPLFASEGIALIPLRAGARHVVAELEAPARPDQAVEVVILGGTPAAPPAAVEPPPAAALSPVFERLVDVTSVPILRSHVIDGRPVVPMALIIEWLGQGALQRNPGLTFCGIDDLRLLKGVIVRPDQPETLRVLAGKAVRAEGQYRVAVELRGTVAGGREFVHASATIVLGDRLEAAPDAAAALRFAPLALDPQVIYRDILFHGPELQGIERVDGCDEQGVAILCRTAPAPSAWIEQPFRQAWLTDPLAMDCAFQALVLWSVERSGSCSLPTRVGRYRQYRRTFPTEGVQAVALVTHAAELSARADIALLDADGSLIARIDDYECVIDASLNQAFRRNELTGAAAR
jgi:malonyl CoA-acyl carrier protein transacylase/acyl carrier protein/NADP-dependent 3-hydroxy acid dehydrogenase YdfG